MIFDIIVSLPSGQPFFHYSSHENHDYHLDSGLYSAISSFTEERKRKIKKIIYENCITSIKNYTNAYNQEERLIFTYDNFNIEQGIESKMDYIQKSFFDNFRIPNNLSIIDDKNIIEKVADAANEKHLYDFIDLNIDRIKKILTPVYSNRDNGIEVIALTSSLNNILCYMGDADEGKIKGYLFECNFKSAPQISDFKYLTDEKIGEQKIALVINTYINHPKEAKLSCEGLPNESYNQVLLYFFGNNQLISNIAQVVDEELLNDSYNWKVF